MATVTDNFNRANGAIGANWTQPPASGATLNVISNQCGVSATSTFCADFWNADTFPNDQYSEVVIGTAPTSGSEAVGVIVRAKTGTDEFYLGFVTNSTWIIFERSAGTYTLKVSSLSAAAPGDVIKLEATGNGPVLLVLSKNGTPITGYTTSGGDLVTNGGSPGILILDTGNGLTVDNFQSESDTVIVNLTGVSASPAIGSGSFVIDVVVDLSGVAASPVIGTGTVQIQIPFVHHATDGGRPFPRRVRTLIKADGVSSSPNVGRPRLKIGSIITELGIAAAPGVGALSISMYSGVSVPARRNYVISSQISVTFDGQPMPSASVGTGAGTITTEVDFYPEELAALLQ